MSEISEIYDRLRHVETKQQTHEAVCAERYTGIMQITGDLKQDFKAFNSRLLSIGILLLAGMAGILARLVFK